MKITSINIIGFGKFKDMAMNFEDGINLIYGNNEAGKTTTHTFIKSMLFGMKKKKSKNQLDTYTKYLPIDNDTKYEGTLTFSHDGKEYQIYRKFYETRSHLEIRNISNGKLVDEPKLFLNKVLLNLTIDTFDNTISIGQMKTAQDSTLIKDLQKYIANLNTSGNIAINTMDAINSLRQKKEDLTNKINNDANLMYHRELGNIRSVEKELTNKAYENRIPEIIAKKEFDKKTIDDKNTEIEKLKKEISSNIAKLDSYEFKTKDDIDAVSLRTERYYLDYSPLMDANITGIGIFFNELLVVLGILLVLLGAIGIVIAYPDVATLFKVSNIKNVLYFYTNLLNLLPFKPLILICIFICLGSILIIGNLLSLVFNIQNIGKSEELRNLLSDIFNQFINDTEVNASNMAKFRNQLTSLRSLFDKNDNAREKIESLEKEITEISKHEKEYDEQITAQEKIQYDVEQKYNELYDLRDKATKLKVELDKNDEINKEIESIDLAIDTLSNLSDDIKVAFGTHLNKTASNYIYKLTNGKYDSLSIDDNLNVTINYENQMIPLSKVSTGTMDQIYLALRLAAYDLIKGSKEDLPILFDECFAMYDNERISSTIKLLHDDIKSQILLFSCQTREAAYLEVLRIPFNRITLK